MEKAVLNISYTVGCISNPPPHPAKKKTTTKNLTFYLFLFFCECCKLGFNIRTINKLSHNINVEGEKKSI